MLQPKVFQLLANLWYLSQLIYYLITFRLCSILGTCSFIPLHLLRGNGEKGGEVGVKTGDLILFLTWMR